jgi:hypothetical protein
MFSYGQGQPGLKLPEGGEIRHENVRVLGQAVQTWIMAYQYTGPALSATAPFAAPTPGGQFGPCVDERTSATWPFTPITGATYLDLPKVTLTGPGITGSLEITKSNPPNTVGNSTFRTYGFTYGGGGIGATAPLGFNGTLTAAESTPGGDYTLDIGKTGGTASPSETMTYHMPDAFTAPLGIGGAATVMITAHQAMDFSWTAPANDKGASGFEHNRKTYFNFTLFADPTSKTNPPLFICFPDKDGHQNIPVSVIDAIPAAGLIVNADLSHYMETREAATGEQRRFDLVSIYCNISAYAKQ